MSLRDWLANRWIVAHEPSVEEMADLLAVVDRDLEDAAVPRLSGHVVHGSRHTHLAFTPLARRLNRTRDRGPAPPVTRLEATRAGTVTPESRITRMGRIAPVWSQITEPRAVQQRFVGSVRSNQLMLLHKAPRVEWLSGRSDRFA